MSPVSAIFRTADWLKIFLTAAKGGTAIDDAARDSAVVASIALQHGVDADTLRHALMRSSNGVASGPLGTLLDLLAKGPRLTVRSATPEQAMHRAVCQQLRQRGARGLLWFHVPNGGRRSPIEAAIYKGLGVRAGVSDFDPAPRRQSVCARIESRARTADRSPDAIHLRISRSRR